MILSTVSCLQSDNDVSTSNKRDITHINAQTLRIFLLLHFGWCSDYLLVFGSLSSFGSFSAWSSFIRFFSFCLPLFHFFFLHFTVLYQAYVSFLFNFFCYAIFECILVAGVCSACRTRCDGMALLRSPT